MVELPSGTITFLFTDIEGSTRLWEEHPDSMRRILARHDEIASSIVSDFEGVVVRSRGEGDSIFAVFPLASDAVAAARALQSELLWEPWPDALPLKVRMAVHTGEADLRDGDYYGSAVNRCARLRAIGHGGQVLVSRTTYELVRDCLPDRIGLRDAGEQRLRDLARPEQVFQLLHPDLPSDFPPLKSLDALPNNLPQQLTSFIGREAEMTEVRRLLAGARLLTLTGSGGCGKTRLALQVAADLLDTHSDGVWLVELAPLSDPGLVPQAVASALHIREEPGKNLTHALSESLKGKHLLLILDNCEHLLDSCAPLADTLLRACPDLRLLATSREGIGIAGEQTYRVPSLTLPDPKKNRSVESLGQFAAVQLFVERALLQKPDFAVTNENAPALAAVCQRLDGIPLAIELAAARIGSLSVEEVNQRLDQRFRLLTSGSRTALPRQQTLRSLIDWSYDLLNEPERALLCRLSVFAGGWTLGAAEKVCSGSDIDEPDIFDLLASLSAKSLVAAEQQDGATRYRLLETVRQYARDRLLDRGESEDLRGRHLAYFLELAEDARPRLTGAEQRQWLETLETEHDNMRAALVWARDSHDAGELGLQLASGLWRFWEMRGHLSEGRRWLAELLELAGGDGDRSIRAKALHAAGSLAVRQGENLAARALYDESLAMWRAMNDRRGISIALSGLATVVSEQGDYAAARGLYAEGLAIERELGDRWGIAVSLGNLAAIATELGDYPAARELIEECVGIYRELGDRRGMADCLNSLGIAALETGDYASARAYFDESLPIWRGLGYRLAIAMSLVNKGTVALEVRDYASARAYFEESLAIGRDIGDVRTLIYALDGFAFIATGLHDPLCAARLWGTADRLRDETGAPMPPNERPRYERHISAARAALADDSAFDRAWQEGRAMKVEQAIQYALDESGELD